MRVNSILTNRELARIFPIQKFMALVAFGSICSQIYPTEKTHVTSANILGVCALTEVSFPKGGGKRENAPPAKSAEVLGRAWPRNLANSEGRSLEWRAARPNNLQDFLGRAWPRNPANSEGRPVEWRAARPNNLQDFLGRALPKNLGMPKRAGHPKNLCDLQVCLSSCPGLRPHVSMQYCM